MKTTANSYVSGSTNGIMINLSGADSEADVIQKVLQDIQQAFKNMGAEQSSLSGSGLAKYSLSYRMRKEDLESIEKALNLTRGTEKEVTSKQIIDTVQLFSSKVERGERKAKPH